MSAWASVWYTRTHMYTYTHTTHGVSFERLGVCVVYTHARTHVHVYIYTQYVYTWGKL